MTGSTQANHRSARSLRPRPTSRGPKRVQRGTSPAPQPRRGPGAGTKSQVLGQPPRAPRSGPVNPGAQAPGLWKGTTAWEKLTGAPRATGPGKVRRTNAGPGGTTETHAAGHHQGTRTGAKQQRPPGAANPESATNKRSEPGARANPNHTLQTPASNGGLQAEGANRHTHPNSPARSGGAQPKPEPKHTHPRRTSQPGLAGYRRSAHTNTHTHPNTPASIGGAEPKPNSKHTHAHRRPQPG